MPERRLTPRERVTKIITGLLRAGCVLQRTDIIGIASKYGGYSPTSIVNVDYFTSYGSGKHFVGGVEIIRQTIGRNVTIRSATLPIEQTEFARLTTKIRADYRQIANQGAN